MGAASGTIPSLVRGGVPPLYGLVMAGGRSLRMGRDKALIQYHGEPQAERMFRLLGAICERTYYSCRPDQEIGLPASRIVDRRPDRGPAEGLLTAHHAHPGAAWLVVACDLPWLDQQALRELAKARAPELTATVFLSARGFPEPLCAIYEPGFFAAHGVDLDSGAAGPIRILQSLGDQVKQVAPSNPLWTENINTPGDADQAMKRLGFAG
ncbi:MAG: putative molybdenum cofactor guanylyltransferase [Myxococcota bacterium]|nr:putative molybdenum cofactor guanylyltransferase [Myxococcota bacterium]